MSLAEMLSLNSIIARTNFAWAAGAGAAQTASCRSGPAPAGSGWRGGCPSPS
jgi:hypothetical protein